MSLTMGCNFLFLIFPVFWCRSLKGFTVYSDIYKCSTIFYWKEGALEILGISYEKDGISIDEILRDISELSGVSVPEIKRLLRKLQRRSGYYYTTLKDLKDFIKDMETGREEILEARVVALSRII